MKKRGAIIALCLAVGLVGILVVRGFIYGSSHREAPITALDNKADITDFYAFRSYNASGDKTPPKVTMILCVDPFLDPANGPNWFPFDPNILYEIKVDNNNDAWPEVVFQFRFSTQYQLPGVYTGLAGFNNGANAPGTSTLVVPPQITDFSNPGLNLRQTYTVTMIKNGVFTQLTNSDGSPFYAVPANAGPRTMVYTTLFNAGTYTNLNSAGASVFAGTVDDPFFIDLGAAFDTGNFRVLEGGPPSGTGVPGVLSDTEDAASANFTSDTVSGYAVNAIAIEVPVQWLTSTGNVELATSPAATIGAWGTTSRARVTVRRSPNPERNAPAISNVRASTRTWRQVQRLGNPLINELIIGIGSKDRWSMDLPVNDSQFASFDLDPPFVHIVDALYGVLVPGALTEPPPPRTDLLPLVTYAPPIAATGTTAGPLADLLRLNTGVAATAPASASRLGLLAPDAAGFPNGRRLFDDVVDIALRVVVGGVLAGNKCGSMHNTSCNVFPNNRLGDGVNVNDVPFRTDFPYLADCPSGRGRVHIDPGEPGCTVGGVPGNCPN